MSEREIGEELHRLAAELFPFCRSITGDGVRKTLRRLQQRISLDIHEVPSGTEVFDWTVPREWNIRSARIVGPDGDVVADMEESNLHVVGYSTPVRARMPLEELRPHLYSLPEHPDRIPYRTSYYQEGWGFCLRHQTFAELREGEYEVEIDSTLEDGHLTYGECLLPGETEEEVLISTHCCHPSLANDNLSGIVVATALAGFIEDRPRRYSYRFLFIPGTIGSITWLALNEAITERIRHGLVLTGIGDAGSVTYKRTREGDAEIDRAMEYLLRESGRPHSCRDFTPYGYDERQYGSPGFKLPVGCLMRTPHGEYPEYHTSADDLDFIRPESLADSYRICRDVLDLIEKNRVFVNTSPKGEPQLGRRGLYRTIGGSELPEVEDAMLWILSFADGTHSLLDIAERSRIPFATIESATASLCDADLLAMREREGD